MNDITRIDTVPTALLPEEQAWLGLPSVLPVSVRHQLLRMFRDEYVPGTEDRAELLAQLREAMALAPAVPELRVLLAMVLCVHPAARGSHEELREAARRLPYNFSARLKLGELLMRLRIWDQATEQTHIAAELAANALEAELARRQAATIRGIQREGSERGRKADLFAVFRVARRRFSTNGRAQPRA